MKPDVPSATHLGSRTPAASFASYLAARREGLLEAWRAAVDADPALTSSDDLSRTQFRDHIPQVLAEFESRLLEEIHPGSFPAPVDRSDASIEHGQHRWQQGYDLREVILEWAHLHRCLLNELELARVALPDLTPEVFFSAHRSLAALIHMAIADSAEQFARLQQKDAIRERDDLERTVTRFIEDGRRWAATWRESSHDLRGQLSIIASATLILEEPALEEPLRAECLETLQKSTRTLKDMLTGVLEDTRMETSREELRLDAFDAGTLLGGLCAATQPLARERGLSLRSKGPESLRVEGDRNKVQRIAQNLLLNALRYTAHGSVAVSWQEDDADWWSFQVQDTGPGLPSKNNAVTGRGMSQPPGEGIGLSIVRRLSELLGARLHTETASGAGTTFSVTFPRRYAD
jgi:signal transduction histidine kinase